MKALNDPQNCPNCGEEISPILYGAYPQMYGGYMVFISNATCPLCGGKWMTQLKEEKK